MANTSDSESEDLRSIRSGTANLQKTVGMEGRLTKPKSVNESKGFDSRAGCILVHSRKFQNAGVYPLASNQEKG